MSIYIFLFPQLYHNPQGEHGEYGIWSTGKKIVRDNVKNLINCVFKKKIAQKADDMLISGATY